MSADYRLHLVRCTRAGDQRVRSAIALVETDLGFGVFGWRGEEWLKPVPEYFQGAVVFEEGPIYFGKTFQDGGVGGDGLALFHEGADDIDTHFYRAFGAQNIRSHQRAVFGESPRQVASPAVTRT